MSVLIRLALCALSSMSALVCLAQEEVEFETIRPDIATLISGNPKDILELRKAIEQVSKGTYIPLAEISNAVAETTQIKLGYGEEMPVVYGLKFQPTTVEFLDVTGAPWPISEFKGYNGAFLQIEASKGTAGHLLFMTPKKAYGEAVVAVLLEGLPTAINFIVKSDNSNFHRVKKIQVMRLGTQTDVTSVNLRIAEQAGQEIDEALQSASYGIRPNGFRNLVTHNEQVIAWTNDEEIYVYSSLNPILPDLVNVANGQNPGWRAFSFPLTSRLTMSNDIGSVVEVILENEVSLIDGSTSTKRYIKRSDSKVEQSTQESESGISALVPNTNIQEAK